jgi:type I restriction enzyme, S subunit
LGKALTSLDSHKSFRIAISNEEHNELIKRCRPEFGNLLLTKVGTTGIAKVVDIDIEFSIFVSLALLKFSQELVFPYYLELMINSPFVKTQSQKNTQGVGNKNLVLRCIKNFTVPLPPLAEQKRIVAKVDRLVSLCDELEERKKQRRSHCINLNNGAVTQLLNVGAIEEFDHHWQRICNNFDLLYNLPENITKLRQAILQLAVRGKLVPQDPEDEPALLLLQKIQFEKEKLLKEGKIGRSKSISCVDFNEIPYGIPSSWQWLKLGNLVKSMTNGIYKPASFYSEGGVACIRMFNIQNGQLDLTELKRVIIDESELENYKLEEGDLVVNRVNIAILNDL